MPHMCGMDRGPAPWDAAGVDSEPDGGVTLPRAVDLHQRIRAITTGVVLLSRVGTLAMVALSIASLARADGYANKPLATVTYLTVAAWSVAFVPAIATRDPIPGWMLATDVTVTSAAVAVLPWSLTDEAFATVAVPDFEPVAVSTAVTVALATASWRATIAGCLALAVAFALAQFASPDYADVASTSNIIGWQVVTAACCCLFIRRLRAVADAVDTATDQVIAARERVAARRSQAEERIRHFREQVRRHRALHDGPLRVLTAIAGQGPAGHPDPRVRRQAAISANVLRGTTPDDPGGTLTELSLALIEAGNDSAAQGLRVEYHFANLPDTLPPEVLQAFRLATGEALANVARHSGSSRVRLTALATPPDRPAPSPADPPSPPSLPPSSSPPSSPAFPASSLPASTLPGRALPGPALPASSLPGAPASASSPGLPSSAAAPVSPAVPSLPASLPGPVSPADPRPAPTVTVAVVDQGKGFDPDTTPLGYGIRHSITERMREVGGAAGVDSHPGQGTRVDLRWPA
ncbi:hypothetical protein Asp14428_71760 [Actinoplanes sp. NBRC 14428]|nr:hypothetical protein Asp14428_71760 [Actinoplanes sp. NBRC 14428]